MQPFKKFNSVLRIIQFLTAAVLTGMMIKAMKLLYLFMKKDGLF